MTTDVPVIVCTACGDTYSLDGATWDDLRAEGYHPRRVHGRRGLPGRCPAHPVEGEE